MIHSQGITIGRWKSVNKKADGGQNLHDCFCCVLDSKSDLRSINPMLLSTNNATQSSLNCCVAQRLMGNITLPGKYIISILFVLIPAVVSDLLCHCEFHLYYLQSFLHTFMTYNYCVKLPLKLPPLQARQSHLQVVTLE